MINVDRSTTHHYSRALVSLKTIKLCNIWLSGNWSCWTLFRHQIMFLLGHFSLRNVGFQEKKKSPFGN